MASPITCHVLDSTLGKPGKFIEVKLDKFGPDDQKSETLALGQTNGDGRVPNLLPPSHKLTAGNYKMTFFTQPYFTKDNRETFYPRVEILFTIPQGQIDPHYHIPLLISPFSYTTYRGS
ncbi:unnamed protein product [Sympodiomycopsis kandeliae]